MLVTKNINLTDTTLQTVIDVPNSFQMHLKTVYIVNSDDVDNAVTVVVEKVPNPDTGEKRVCSRAATAISLVPERRLRTTFQQCCLTESL